MSHLNQRGAACRLLVVTSAAVALSLGALALHDSTAQERDDPATQASLQDAKSLSTAFRAAAEEVLPTVVTIEARVTPQRVRAEAGDGNQKGNGRNRNRGELEQPNPFKGTPWEDFFGDEFGGLDRFEFDPRGAQPSEGTGSGVIISAEGIILTNNHVVEGADEVVVRLADGREFGATDIKTDPDSDLAVLRIEGAGTLPAARMGDSDDLEIGDWVLAIGNPFHLDQTVSAGIISSKGRELVGGNRTRYVQTDAAINPGNSGGPLVNLDGEVVGINTAIYSNSGGYQGVGFAIPANLAKWVTQQLIDKGVVQRAYLGVGIGQINATLADQLGVAAREGVVVAEVFPGSPAEKAGFEEGDIITAFDSTPINSPRELQEYVERAKINSQQRVTVLRNGKEVQLTVRPEPLPSEFGIVSQNADRPNQRGQQSGYTSDELGLDLSDMTAQQARQLGLEGYEGALITGVHPGSSADQAALSEGMLVLKVGRTQVSSVEEFRDAVEELDMDDGVLLLVRTAEGNRFVVLEP